ncbi:polysaccharide biosynthesis protein [Photobacterium phosphoreum]|uniref:polysaccharide biosynthesis protein n=1 Tax=Photobacterium phosphoreum TaxID=659 RepID=UPI0007F905F2|nr:nucleoside-diphosphate sugar epimerase/dehydratase [Photobacterium phosphoreum]OBU38021.1 nucleoside-diphosphate sugar epimerase [Photobacterium phosphoreum]PSW38833.1 polysaccharide biosynthesis protein [Photobacterium phosphoreum]
MKGYEKILFLSRPKKRIISCMCDAIFISVAYFFAFFIRLDHLNVIYSVELWKALVPLILLTIFIFSQLGLYRAILRYLTFQALFVVCIGALFSMFAFYGLRLYIDDLVPRTVPIIYALCLVLFAGGSRMIMRNYISNRNVFKAYRKNVIIYGAGSTGRQLCFTLRSNQEYKVVAFVDKDPTLFNTNIMGVRVYNSDDIIKVIDKKNVTKILLALPSASRSERKSVLYALEPLSIEVQTVPDVDDILSGKSRIDELRDVAIEDLLGRDPVAPHVDLFTANITGKVVMVTGAGGSIGSELCRQILHQKPSKLLLFEVSEYNLYAIDKELAEIVNKQGLDVEIYPLLGSVQRENRLQVVMESFQVQTIYHAAAYKHVPMVEFNVIEGIRNNIFGTLYTAQAAIAAGVETFVLISTDKAVRPTNVMGTTKRMAELSLQALAEISTKTRFCMVRFGNVLGSSGSVIPLFKRQIAEGGPITVTDPNIIRYFMTIPEAAQLVIQAGAMGKGGDVFVLDMGDPVKIAELAAKLIKLSGLEVKDERNPNGDVEIQFTGLRPGEKLYEELLIGDNVGQTQHQRIMTADEDYLPWSQLEPLLLQLDSACHEFHHERVREILLAAPTGFVPTDGICDLVWNTQSHPYLADVI